MLIRRLAPSTKTEYYCLWSMFLSVFESLSFQRMSECVSGRIKDTCPLLKCGATVVAIIKDMGWKSGYCQCDRLVLCTLQFIY